MILVTGAAGFIGINTIISLNEKGIKVFNRFKASFSDNAGTIAKPIMFSISIAMSELLFSRNM